MFVPKIIVQKISFYFLPCVSEIWAANVYFFSVFLGSRPISAQDKDVSNYFCFKSGQK